MAELSKTFPNIPVTHWFSLRTQFNKTIPTTITSNYLASVLKMTEQSAKANILPSLKQIGLVSPDGKTIQDVAKKFRDDASYPQLCKKILEDIYPQELNDAFPDKDSDREQVKSWFMNHSGIGDNAAQRITAFYIAMVEANLNPPQSKIREPKPKVVKDKPIKKIDKPKEQSVDIKEHHQENQPQDQKSKGPDLNINIQIHISSDASADQIKTIFENMAKYVYKV